MANDTITQSIRPGDIVCGDMGYSMSIPVFYEVVSLTPSGKSARIRRLDTRDSADDGYGFTGRTVPVPGSYKGELKTRRIKVSTWCSDAYEYVSDGGHAYRVWDGKPKYFDYLD